MDEGRWPSLHFSCNEKAEWQINGTIMFEGESDNFTDGGKGNGKNRMNIFNTVVTL